MHTFKMGKYRSLDSNAVATRLCRTSTYRGFGLFLVLKISDTAIVRRLRPVMSTTTHLHSSRRRRVQLTPALSSPPPHRARALPRVALAI
ncbi:MAG: hypothetical protein ACPIOQ_69065 [Promethearchaeia archaeon]